MSLTPKNWHSFQHYKDRAPLWIKLHRGLLDNIDYHRLSAEAGKSLPLIWLIASERDGIIPDAAELSFRLRLSEELASDILLELVERGFLISSSEAKPAEQVATLAQRTAKANGFGSRHISDATKRAVWERDGGKCCSCGSTKNIEYDHKHPVSKGGNSEEGNIQLLCRPCNRAKRVSLATPAQPLRSLEKRREEIQEREEEREKRAREPKPASPKSKTGPLPSDWQPSAKSYEIAEQFGQNVQIVEGIFRDYLASSGKQYADYNAAFHNFIRNQNSFNRGGNNGVRQSENRGSIVNAADRAIAHLEREIAADNEGSTGVVLSLPAQRLR